MWFSFVTFSTNISIANHLSHLKIDANFQTEVVTG